MVNDILNPDVKEGYIKCYLDGDRWTYKTVGHKSLATKFDLKTANWRSEKMQKNDSYGVIMFYPVEA